MAMSAEHRSKFAALHRSLWRLHMSLKNSSGPKNLKQTNKNNLSTVVNSVFGDDINEIVPWISYKYATMLISASPLGQNGFFLELSPPF